MKTALALLVSMLIGSQAFAQIGAAKEGCIAIFGAPVENPGKLPGADKVLAFERGEYRIQVGFIEDKAAKISYRKIPKETDVLPVDLTEAEIAPFLDENGAGQKWEKRTAVGLVYWQRADGAASAQLNKLQHSFDIVTPEFNQRAAAAAKKAAEEFGK